MIPIGYNDYFLGQSDSPRTAGSNTKLIAVLIFCMAAVAFMLFKLEAPPAEAKVAQLELEKVLAQERMEEARKKALKNEIQSKISLMEGKLDELEQEIDAVDSAFLSLFEVPLEQAHLTMSRKTARRVLQSPEFLTQLTQLLNTRFPQDSLVRQRDTIWKVASSVSVGSISESYVEALDQALIWILDKQQVLQLQRSILDQLQQSAI
ncbi:MAG: hypothetical protein K9N55_17085 [Phycisphaerae bacterium]|nr:hypothetical protein [Phycisphaerae bacterium]